MREKIYIQDVGYRCPISDFDEIVWFFEQISKNMHKSHKTRFWLNLKEKYLNILFNLQAFELIGFLSNKTSTEQEKRRKSFRDKQKVKSKVELEAFYKITRLNAFKNASYL